MGGVNLSRRLVLEALQRAPDNAGGFFETWQPLGTLWAEVKPGRGRETRGAAASVSVLRFRVTVRGAPTGHSNRPVPGQRFRMGTRLFRIEAVTEREPDGKYLICDVEEELAT